MTELQRLMQKHEEVLSQIFQMENEAFVEALSVASSWKLREQYRDTINHSLMTVIRRRLHVSSERYIKLQQELGALMWSIRRFAGQDA